LFIQEPHTYGGDCAEPDAMHNSGRVIDHLRRLARALPFLTRRAQ
jgi:hypothetical protein